MIAVRALPIVVMASALRKRTVKTVRPIAVPAHRIAETASAPAMKTARTVRLTAESVLSRMVASLRTVPVAAAVNVKSVSANKTPSAATPNGTISVSVSVRDVVSAERVEMEPVRKTKTVIPAP